MNKNNHLACLSQRRALLGAIAVVTLAAPCLSWAQKPAKVWRVGFLAQRARPQSIETDDFGGFLRGMKELGLVEGKHFTMEWRFADGSAEQLSVNAAELVRLGVDVIVAGGTPAALAAAKVTYSIPIVMGSVADPVGNGLVKSLARPGRNVTGLENFGHELSPKLLELLISFVPKVNRVAVLVNPNNVSNALFLKSIQEASRKLKVSIVPQEVRNAQEIDRAFAAMAQSKVGAVIVSGDGLFMQQQKQVSAWVQKLRLPSVGLRRANVENGQLMSYGPNNADIYRRAAVYVDKILKGTKPADLQVEQPTIVELVINGRTAKTLGLTIPKELMVLANKVID